MARNLLDYWSQAPEDPFGALFENAPIMMHAIDQDGLISNVSKFWANTLGYDPQEMIGRRATDFMTETGRKKVHAVFYPGLLKSGKISNTPLEFQHKDGHNMPVLVSAKSQKDAVGKMVECLAVIFDNSDSIIDANVVEENRAKSRFLAAMSHEIRTPMNAILGFAQLLRRSNLDNKQKAQLDAIISASQNLMRLLSDLLDLSRLEAGKMQLIKEPFNLHKMIDEVMDLWHSNAFEKGLRLRCTLDRDVAPRVVSDSGRIRQVLNNFLSNAIKFTDKGVITVEVEEVSRDQDISVVRFSVSDNGLGIPEEDRDRLFVPFVQTETGTSSAHQGWGLGLSICHHIATILNAKISCESNPDGQGMTFSFELPLKVLAQEIPETRVLRPSDIPTKGSGLQVLVAEDNIMNQDVIESMLVELGHSVTVVSNGFEALKKLQDTEYDLILMDVSMPGLDGVSATEQIRNFANERRNVPIIAVTGNITSGAREMYRSLGMNDYIPKPVSLEDLGRVIYRAVSGIS